MVNRNFDNFGSDEMSTPEVKLIQNTGGDEAKAYGAKPGDFFISLSSEVIPGSAGFDMAVVDIIKTRTYWGRDEIGNEPPECSSANALSMKSNLGDDCSVCERRVEMPGLMDKDERRTKCLPSYNILGIRLDESRLPVLIRASGISVKHARDLNSALKLNRQIAGHIEKALIHVNSVKEKTASGEAFAFVFRLSGLLPEDKAQEILALSESLLGNITIPAETEIKSLPAKSDKLPEIDINF